MGTILSNPFDLNFGVLAKRAENIYSPDKTNFAVETLTTDNFRYDVISSQATACNTLIPYVVYVMKITALDTGDVNYRVEYTKNGQNPIDSSQVFSTGGNFTNLADATAEQNRFVTEQNGFTAKPGCSDTNALNYTPYAATGNCPCETQEPVFPDEYYYGDEGETTTHSVTYNTVDKEGDCTCIEKPEYYVLQEWRYQGVGPCWGSNMPRECYGGIAGNEYVTEKWAWDTPERSEYSSRRGNQGTSAGNQESIYTHTEGGTSVSVEDYTLSLCSNGYRADIGNINTDEFWVWHQGGAIKLRSITNTGECQKMGCMDSNAINYDSDATLQIEAPAQTSKNWYNTVNWSIADKEEIAAHYQELNLYNKYKCIYCDGLNQTGVYNHSEGICECKDGYENINGGCVEKRTPAESSSKIPITLVMGVIVAVAITGIAATTISEKRRRENHE